MRRIILFLQLLLGVEMIYAQTETEILNYSRLSYAGSARAAAMGGAFGALGGDISSWNLNPAAVGVFRKSSVTYTSVLNFSGNESGELTARKTSYLIGTVGAERQAEEAPILIRNAVTRDKSVELIRTGTSKEPGHYLSYRILFQLDDGTEEWLSVPPEYYEAIPVGVRDKLITQNGVFLDYGDRFGKDIL